MSWVIGPQIDTGLWGCGCGCLHCKPIGPGLWRIGPGLSPMPATIAPTVTQPLPADVQRAVDDWLRSIGVPPKQGEPADAPNIIRGEN